MVADVYYAAASDSPHIDFSFARDVGINKALAEDLNKVRLRCRHELKQNGLAKALPHTFADSVVNTGPKLSVIGAPVAWAQSVEKAFARWARTCDYMTGGSLGMMTHLGVRQWFPAGEYLKIAKMVRSENGDDVIPLRFMLIRPDRLKSPMSVPKGKIINNGVEVNSDGVPVAYWILKADPDNNLDGMVDDLYERIPAEQVIHVFYPEDVNQTRGEPWLAAGLPVFHKLRRWDEAQIAAATVAAKFAAVLVNLNPGIVEASNKILPSTVQAINDGQILVPPPGYEPRQIDPKQPNANGADFRRDQLTAATMPTGVPADIATGDASRANMAAQRYAGVGFFLAGKVSRKIIEDRDLNRTFAMWFEHALAARLFNDPESYDWTIRWLWPREDRHTDPTKLANASRVRLETGEITVGELQMENGEDKEEAREALLEEVTWYRANGLVHPVDAPTRTVTENIVVDDDEDSEGKQNAD